MSTMETKVSSWLSIKNLYLIVFPIFLLALNVLAQPQSMAEVETLSAHSFLFCPFHTLTNLLCPGCGMTRSLLSFFTGHLLFSFQFNPFGPLVGLGLIILWFLCFKPISMQQINRWVDRLGPAFLVLLLVWGVVRNLDGFF